MRRGGQIRITSGEFSGRLVDTPTTTATQPMGERERLAIFNQLHGSLENMVVLDAFAGSGALGLTALSCGAKSVDFIEKHPKAIKTIQTNLAKLGLEDKGKIVRSPNSSYDIIFADPPYQRPQYPMIEKIVGSLKPGGLFILSHPSDLLPPDFHELALISNRKYAAANIRIYQKI